MSIEEALAIIDNLIKPNYLTDVQELVFRQTWLGKTYQEIAENHCYNHDYIRGVGSNLWQMLSDACGIKITKNNIRSFLRHYQSLNINNHGKQESIKTERSHKIEQNIDENQQSNLKLEFPDGPVPLESPFYISRSPVEKLCYDEILKQGSLIRIKAPRRWGKTSLMLRIIAYAKSQGYQIIRLNFQQVDGRALKSLDKFMRWFCANLSYQLGLKPLLNEYWDEELGSKVSCTTYLQGYILSKIEHPIVIALDEVNLLFEYPDIAREFLPMLRFWHEEAKNLDIWKKFRLIVAHSTEIYIPLNINQSPFNVGLPVRLPEFNFEQIKILARYHRIDWDTPQQQEQNLKALQAAIGGHPYLVRLAFYHLSRQDVTMTTLLQEASTQTGIYRDHLQSYLGTLYEHPELAMGFKTTILSEKPVVLEPIVGYKLESMGLVKILGDMATPSCHLYRTYFQNLLN